MAIKINNVTVISDTQQITSNTTASVTGNVTGGNILTAGLISATGNITGSYILGNGSLLTGIDATSIQNGTSNVRVVSSGGNVAIGVGGTSNVVVWATTGAYVTGVSSVSGNITGGNIISNAVVGTALTLKSTGALNLSSTGNVVFASNVQINNVGYPAQDADAATKLYVDTAVTTGFAFHTQVTAATTTTLATATGGSITYAQPNGVANGVGAKLTTTGSFNLIDTANVQTVGTRILVKNEANTVFNGVYTWANATNIVRSTDTDEYGPDSTVALSVNDYFFVSSGNVNSGSAFVVSAPTGTITFGTSGIEFSQFSSSQVYSAGTGLTLNGTTFSVNASQTQVTSVGTLGSLAVTGGITAASLSAATIGNAAAVHNGATVSITGTVTAATVNAAAIGNTGATLTGTLQTAAQTNITSVGTLTGGTWNATSISTTYTDAKVTSVASRTGAVTLAQADISGLTTGSTPTFAGLTVSTGSITGGNIINGNGNGIGNIGSSSVYFNTVFAKATSAQYADLAENYRADADYEPGTVLEFGGDEEVTISTTDSSKRVAGVVSTNPAYLMNAGLSGMYVASVALTGRVPVKVAGPVAKGDLMVSNGNGRARACVDAVPVVGTIIGKSLENFTGGEGTIEVVIGKQ